MIGGLTPACTQAAAAVYATAVDRIVEVSSPEAAELTKLLENIFRSVNIALVERARPPLRPDEDRPLGGGRGGGDEAVRIHELQARTRDSAGTASRIDPFYLTWKAREYDFTTEFIELAGKVNQSMPYYCRSLISQALNHGAGKSLAGSKVLVLGVSYKPNIGDMRESPALKIIELIRNAGAKVSYHDPYVPELPDEGLSSVALDPGALRLRRDRHRSFGRRLREAGRGREPRRRLPERHRPGREREGLEALTDEAVGRVGVAGLGYWGPNLARNFDELAELSWICDSEAERLATFAGRYPDAKATSDFDEMLADESLDAVVIATPVPTHHELARRTLAAGKHVLVEKPPAMRGVEMDELVDLAAAGNLVLMPGHLLLYHPGVQKLKELIDAGELGEVLCVYGNRQNLGIVRTNENALWSLGVHDLSVILYLLDEDPETALAHGRDFLTDGVEDVVFCYLRFPSGKIAHMHLSWLDPHKMRRMTVVGRDRMAVFDDMELERKVTIYDKAPWKRAETYGEWQTRSGDIFIPKIPTSEPLRLECEHFLRLVAGEGDRQKVALDGARVVRALEQLTDSLRG